MATYLGRMRKFVIVPKHHLLQDSPIMCRSRNPSSNKCEPPVKVTYGQHILSLVALPIEIRPLLLPTHNDFDLCSIYGLQLHC